MIGDDALSWIAEQYFVVAPGLLGYCGSTKPRGDSSFGAHANGIPNLLRLLGHERAGVIG